MKTDKHLQLDTKGKTTLSAILTSKTLTEAAQKLDISRDTLYVRIDQYNLRKYMDEIPSTALAILKQGSIQAAEVLIDALGDRQNRLQAAESILDRVGVGKTPQVMIQNNQVINEIEFFTDEPST